MALHSVTVPIASGKKLPMYPVTAGWAVEVRQRAADRGVELREVARAGGISSQTLSGLLAGRYRHSVAVPRINAFLGIGGGRDQAITLLESMDDETRSAWLDIGRRLVATVDPQPEDGGQVIDAKIARMRASLSTKSRQGVVLSPTGDHQPATEVGAPRRRTGPR